MNQIYDAQSDLGKAYKQGWKAETLDNNPFPRHSAEAHAYDAGKLDRASNQPPRLKYS